MISRRGFIGVGIGAGRILTPVTTKVARAKSRYAEVEARIAAKDFLGLSKEDLPTPCLLVDQAIFEQNLRTMAAHSRATGLKIRPHVKIHKCVEIAKRQIAQGAIGLTTATIAEAELMSGAGFRTVLWTRQPRRVCDA